MPLMELDLSLHASDWNRNEAMLAQGIFDEFERFAKCRLSHKRDHQRKMPLWLFLIAILRADHKQICLSWKNIARYEFVVKDKGLVAKLWGLLKQNPAMDYPKLTRALRYYYKKELIEKAIDQPYTYRFIVSEKTLRYLPSQEELMQRIVEDKAECTSQRTKSLPDFLSVFSSLVQREEQPTGSHGSHPMDSDISPSGLNKFLLLDAVEKRRTESLPTNIKVQRQDSDASSWVTSTDSSSDAPLSPLDDLKESLWSDSMDEFLFGEKKFPQKVPVTACFKACDMPLLNFQDILRLDESTSDSYSVLSPECSDKSYDAKLNDDTSFWISKMNENPELKLPIEMEVHSYGTGSVHCKNGSYTDRAIDLDVEMEIMKQVIDDA